MARTGKLLGKQRQLRIIGGTWRGRKLTFPDQDGLRPTGDRIRETLFNWLAPVIHGARCADLFAGSGALGLEALSRGASHCDFVDTSPAALSHITSSLQALSATERAVCHQQDASLFLEQVQEPFDIVFVDPPFEQRRVEPTCAALANHGLLATDALIYIETGTNEAEPGVPASWSLHRQKVSGAVAYRLFTTAS